MLVVAIRSAVEAYPEFEVDLGQGVSKNCQGVRENLQWGQTGLVE